MHIEAKDDPSHVMNPDPQNSASKSGRTSSPAVTFALTGAPTPSPMGRGKSPLSSGRANRSSRGQSAFHPVMQTPSMILTPKGDRTQSMILLSPSRTIGESLTTLASSTAHQLEEIWNEVGYNPEERASQLSDLMVKFRDLCDAKVAEERGVAVTFRQTIADAKEELRTTGQALKTLVDPQLLRDNHGQTLTDELSTMEAALDGLRRAANAARADLKKCRDDLVEAHEALGLEMDPKWRDIETDLTAERREEFHRKQSDMKDELNSRTSAVIQLLRDCQHLLHDLRVDTDKNGTDLDRRIAGSLVRSKNGNFIVASKFQTDTCTGISSAAMEELTSRLSELSGEKRRRKTKLQEMGATIAMLWEKLRIPEEEQRSFTESVQGLGLDTIDKGMTELHRLEALKEKMLGKLILEAREMIQELWDETNATEEQRRGFDPYYVKMTELFNDELLEKHEEYIQTLEARLERMKPILKMIERREDIVRERMEYEELQKDPNRLKGRGAALTKQLMEEEKMARRIKKELPKLSRMLEDKLKDWKQSTGEDFQFRSAVYLDSMKRQEDEWNEYKDREMHLKRMKKQEEQAFVENRFGSSSNYRRLPGKKKGTKPLAQAHHTGNTRINGAVSKASAPSHPRRGAAALSK